MERFFTDEDTEASIERKARAALGIVGNWRRLLFWRDHDGIRLIMTNKPKEIPFQYTFEEDPEILTTQISWSETPRSLLIRLGKKESHHMLDGEGQEFPANDNLFTYASLGTAEPVKIVHGLNRVSGKKRVPMKLRDNRERIEVRFGDISVVTAKGSGQNCANTFDEARRAEHKETWQIGVIRADENTIIIGAIDRVVPFWFTEKPNAPLDESKDALQHTARAVPPGAWGKPPALVTPPPDDDGDPFPS
jgi:hypothetical protein